MFVLEIRRARTEGSINKGGNFQGEVAATEVEVKDTARFPTAGLLRFPARRDDGQDPPRLGRMQFLP